MKPIQTEAEYQNLLAEFQELIESPEPINERFKELSDAIDEYEVKNYPVKPPDPMWQEGYNCALQDVANAIRKLDIVEHIQTVADSGDFQTWLANKIEKGEMK